jgi:small subunit ribosomal protein S1
MIHISDLSWTKKFNHPSEMLQKGQDLKCVVLEVNEEKRRISLGIKQMTEDPWIRAIPEKYIPGQIIKGTITKLTNFGAFVELEPDLEGLLHISELADHKIDKPQDVVKLGEEVEVKILRIDPESRKIGLSLRRARWAAEEHAAEAGKSLEQEEKPEPLIPEHFGRAETGVAEEEASQPKEDEPKTEGPVTEVSEAEKPVQTEEAEPAPEDKSDEAAGAEKAATSDGETPVDEAAEADQPSEEEPQATDQEKSGEPDGAEETDADAEAPEKTDTDNQ